MRMEATRIWTYDDLARLPDDGKRYEILDGDLIVSPSPSRAHAAAVSRLWSAFMRELYTRRIAHVFVAPFDVIFSRERVVVPDILVIRRERQDIVKDRGVEGPPDLAIEVMSSRPALDRVRKFELYAAEGIAEYWLVDPVGKTIEVYVLDEGMYHLIGYYGEGEIAHSALFDVSISIEEAFEDFPWK
jgi:Uma2 family endonuclease